MSTATLAIQSKAHSPAEALLARYADGAIVALSLSEPGRTYRVELDPLTCECPSFQYRRACYHIAAAVAQFGAPTRTCNNCGNQQPSGWRVNVGGANVCADYDACVRHRNAIRRRAGVL